MRSKIDEQLTVGRVSSMDLLSAPDGDAVDFRNTIVIATSKVGAQESNRSVGFGERGGDEREGRIRQALETSFRPEFLNRFEHIVVFHSLSLLELRTVARFELARVLQREGIVAPGLTVDDAALALRGLDALLVRRVDALALEDGQPPELVDGRESIVGVPRA